MMSTLNSKSDAETSTGKKSFNNKQINDNNSTATKKIEGGVQRTPLQRYWFTWQVITAGF